MDSQYFNAARAATRRMDSLAIKQNCIAIMAKPEWDVDFAHKMVKMILHAKGKLSAKQTKSHADGTHTLPLKAFQMRSTPLWRPHIEDRHG